MDFCTQCVTMGLSGGREGGGVIANDVLKMRKIIEFQSS